MVTTARLTLAEDQLRVQLVGPGGVVTKYVIRQIRKIRNRAVLYCPVDTGNLRASITSATSTEGMFVVGRVGTPVNYAAAVHEGLTARQVPVQAHAVKGYTIRAHDNRGRAVPTMSRLPSTRAAHTRSQKARAGRPFLRKAMTEVIDGLG